MIKQELLGKELSGGWHHICYFHNSEGDQIYVDGVLLGSKKDSHKVTDLSQNGNHGIQYANCKIAYPFHFGPCTPEEFDKIIRHAYENPGQIPEGE